MSAVCLTIREEAPKGDVKLCVVENCPELKYLSKMKNRYLLPFFFFFKFTFQWQDILEVVS